MNWFDYLTISLILVGALIMLYAIVSTKKILAIIQTLKIRKTWILLIVLMGIFFIGYLVAAGLVITDNKNLVAIVTGFIFCFGAVFVAITVHTGHNTIVAIQKLYKTSEQAKKLKEAKKELVNKNRELLSKNLELEQFAYISSHDLQEPIRTVTSIAELLGKQYKGKLDENTYKLIHFLTEATTRMSKLIKGLLEYLRIGREIQLVKTDCNEIANLVLEDLSKMINESNPKIHIEQLPVINVYPTLFKQLFQNLITNAIKFRNKDREVLLNISAEMENGHWKFSFKDNGIGIPDKDKESIFAIFKRLHLRNEYEGMGIGLAYCKKIVELHGGNIWVESTLNQGSTFNFTIPNEM